MRCVVTLPNKVISKGFADDALTKKAMKSGEAQSMFDTKIHLSFKLKTASWIPDDVKQKMSVVHKNRITKAGEFVVKCEVTSDQKQNEQLAKDLIVKYIEEA